jgi:hypothetical protein
LPEIDAEAGEAALFLENKWFDKRWHMQVFIRD